MNASHPRLLAQGLALVGASLLIGPSAHAGGLSCSVGEVVIENLKVGHHYSLKSLANLPLSLTNTSDQPMRVSIDALVPGASELRDGAEAIPNRMWASVSPETLDLAPHQMLAAEMTLAIPDEDAIMGRRFQVIFWSHSLPQPGELIAYGLKSRVIFSIDTVRDSSANPNGDLSLSLLPGELHFENLAPGHEYRLEALVGQPLKVKNTSARSIKVELQALSATAAGADMATNGGDLLVAGALKLDQGEFVLAPGEERTITGTVTIRKAGSDRGRNLMCVISAGTIDQTVDTRYFSRIYARAR